MVYIPKLFRMQEWPEIEKLIRKNSFAIVISQGQGTPFATHIPVELAVSKNNEPVLWLHLSRANPQAKHLATGTELLVIFSGPHTYVSSSWYSHLNVPTWNYLAVHVTGRVRVMEEDELHESLRQLVLRYEQGLEKPVNLDTMPIDFVRKEMKGITGYEISIHRVEGKWKLSQNRNEADYRNIIRELEKLNEYNATQVAAEMKALMLKKKSSGFETKTEIP